MKLWIALFLTIWMPGYAQTVVLEGRYQGKNLYIQNPHSDSGFCTSYFTINGKAYPGPLSEAFEIRLDTLGLKLHDTLKVVLHHHPNCKPKVLQDHSSPKITFEILSISVSDSGLLKWTTTKEYGKLPFIIEQFRWNKWVKIGEVEGQGNALHNSYSFQVIPHSGENRVRVKQSGLKSIISPVVTFKSRIQEPKFECVPAGMLMLNTPTMYEIYDKNGNLLMKGFGSKIDVKKLKPDVYYINYDNKTTSFIRSKKNYSSEY